MRVAERRRLQFQGVECVCIVVGPHLEYGECEECFDCGDGGGAGQDGQGRLDEAVQGGELRCGL